MFCHGSDPFLSLFSEALEQTSQREREPGGRCIVPTKRFSNLGLRYTTALPSLNLSSLLGPLQALVCDSYDHFVSKDRGSVRAGNDKTIDSRADYFECWLERSKFSVQLFARLSQNKAIVVVGTFARQVNLGDSLCGQTNLSKKTLMGYMKAATLVDFKITQ
jgi:hypothetical protein